MVDSWRVCYTTAKKESFFGKLKNEWIRGTIYATREVAKQEVFKFIEIFYNRQRRHASLEYVIPVEFEVKNNSEQVA